MSSFLRIECFFPTIHSVKTGLILTLEECTHQLIKPKTAPKTHTLRDLSHFKREHRICKAATSLNVVSLCGYFRGYMSRARAHRSSPPGHCSKAQKRLGVISQQTLIQYQKKYLPGTLCEKNALSAAGYARLLILHTQHPKQRQGEGLQSFTPVTRAQPDICPSHPAIAGDRLSEISEGPFDTGLPCEPCSMND